MPGFGSVLGHPRPSYKPRLKSSKPQKTTPGRPGLSGQAKQGAGGLGANAQKPGFKPGPAAPLKPKAAPTPQLQQPDSIYNDAVDRVGRKEEQQLTDLSGQETGIKRDFGIEDPTDPFSRVNALKKTFLARQKARSVGIAGQGLLYSGTHERAMARTRSEEEQARSELRKAYEAAIGAVGSAKAGVKFSSEEERAQAFEDWLARAPEADVSPEDAAAAGAADSAPSAVPGPGAPAKGQAVGSSGGPGPAKGLVGTVSQGKGGIPGGGNSITGFGMTPAEQKKANARREKAAQAFKEKVAAQKAKDQAAKTQKTQQFSAKTAPKVTAKAKPKVQAKKKKGR